MNRRFFIAGADTLIGGALCRRLAEQGECVLPEPDVRDADEVAQFFARHRPGIVIVAAGKSGGIGHNIRRPAELMLDNLLILTNILPAAAATRVQKLLYLGSSCGYPRDAVQPMRVEDLHTGPLEPTSAAYATAKLAGITLCDAYRQQHGCNFFSAIPANAFGPGDDYCQESGHVIAALIRRMHEAKCNDAPEVVIWGSGTPRREFVYSRDLADACLFLLNREITPPVINLGTGLELSIAELAERIREVVGYEGSLRFDTSKPDGAPRKALDSTPLRGLGWNVCTDMITALRETYTEYLHQETATHGGETLSRSLSDPPSRRGNRSRLSVR
jgi:GDP-L-fucose synthase